MEESWGGAREGFLEERHCIGRTWCMQGEDEVQGEAGDREAPGGRAPQMETGAWWVLYSQGKPLSDREGRE